MKKNILIFLSFFLIIGFSSCSTDNDEINFIDADTIAKDSVWSSNKFCAFTDLVEFNNVFYYSFRESDGHIPSSPGNYGQIRIIKSYDGQTWTDAALISDNNYDLRDPKLEVTSDGRLMLLVGCSSLNQGSLEFIKTKVSFSYGDLTELSNLQDVKQGSNGEFSHFWLWRAIWHSEKAYGVAYRANNKPVLLESTDGVNYEEIIQFDLPTTANETGITFRYNGNMVIAIRDNNSLGYIGESTYPYTNWVWKKSAFGMHCPTLLNINDDIFLATRNTSIAAVSLYHTNKPNSLDFKNFYNINSSGDIGYPGLVASNEFLFCSYYISGHVFLTKVPFSKIYNK